MLPRMRRAIAAMAGAASVIAGRIRCFSPSPVRKLHSTPNTLTVSPRPPAGSQPSCTEKTRISISPSQKPGTDWPSSANTIATLSVFELRRIADSTPIGMAIVSERASAASASSIVTGRRSSTTGKAGS